jgi:hypothetical protein
MHSASAINGFFLESKNNIQQFFHLRSINDNLLEENARLKSLLIMSQFDTAKGVFLFRDSSYINQFEYLPAAVISGTVTKRNNYFTLNRGSEDGVEPDMGVIGHDPTAECPNRTAGKKAGPTGIAPPRGDAVQVPPGARESRPLHYSLDTMKQLSDEVSFSVPVSSPPCTRTWNLTRSPGENSEAGTS